ncbi:ABC transporter permease [uncultured Meiothermus sp.]|jgi:ABC-2 type transport system permease protein|uniref:ABC transporter permease n=1 Tax=uncultured Meiothermus sp. TaxID=157471 RepID=UPI002617FDD1|nr:ABC transporter permease [uncultured Meiothermus sp.]
MKPMLAHYKANLLELLRLPAYWIPSMVFPTMFFLFFAAPNANHPEAASLLLGSYLVFAVLGVVMFQFGVGIASDRASAWNIFERTLPLPPLAKLAAPILTALTFAAMAGAVLVIAAYLSTPARLEPGAWIRLIPALLAGAVPLALLGLCVGYLASPKAAVPVANLLYLPLSFAGGLWVPPQFLPEFVQHISPFTPTRQWGEAVWSAVNGTTWQAEPFIWLAGFTLLFGAIALWGYHRDQGQRFG